MLVNFLKLVENPNQVGKKKDKWFPHVSPEGGLPTLGYGHKLVQDEVDTQKVYNINIKYGCTDKEIDFILNIDIEKARTVATNCVKEFRSLSEKKQDIFTEFAFNLGYRLQVFKKFTKAVISDDWDTAKKEYKRYYYDSSGHPHEVKDRNIKFYEYFLNSYP